MKDKTSLDAFERCILEKSKPRLIARWEADILQIDDLFYILMEQLEQHDCYHDQSSSPDTSQSPSTISNGSLTTFNDFQQVLHEEAGTTHAIEPASDSNSISPFNGNHEHNQSHVTQGVNDSNIDTGSPLARASSVTDTCSCPQCGKKFKRLSNLSAHILTHFNDRPKYKCSKCGDTFYRKSDKTRHINSLHLGIVYPCFCGKSFSRNCNLKKHVREKHKVAMSDI